MVIVTYRLCCLERSKLMLLRLFGSCIGRNSYRCHSEVYLNYIILQPSGATIVEAPQVPRS